MRGDCTSSKRDLSLKRYHIICVTKTDMTQQVASITCSHRGLKAFQSRLVGAPERKNLHRSRCEQQGNGVLDQAERQISSQHLLSLFYRDLEVGRAKKREFANPIALQQRSLLNALALSSDLKALRSEKPKDKVHRSHARQ